MDSLNPSDENIKMLRNKLKIFIGTTILFAVLTIVFIITTIVGFSSKTKQWDTIPSESIIPVTTDIAVEGKIADDSAAYYNRSADVAKSRYYPTINFYDGTVTSTLKILPKFKTYQQSSAISCGDASAFMALRYFGIDTVSEYDLYKEAKTTYEFGTITSDLANAITKLAGDKVSVVFQEKEDPLTQDQFQALVKECTDPSKNSILLLESVEWGGHWMTLIGYDDMGTTETADDVLVFADPFDTTDHNQDGYYIVSFERYYATWFDHNVLPEGHRGNQYIKISKK